MHPSLRLTRFESLDLFGGSSGGTERLKEVLCLLKFPQGGGPGQGGPSTCQHCPASSPGLAVLRSAEPLALGRWHHVSAERLNKDGSLQVNGGRPVLRSSPGKSQGLNLHTLLYLGGVEPAVQLPPATNVSARFHGCVGEVSRLPDHQQGRRGSLASSAVSPGAGDWTLPPPSLSFLLCEMG